MPEELLLTNDAPFEVVEDTSEPPAVPTERALQPTTAALAGGGYVALWISQTYHSGGNDDYVIRAQRYGADGDAAGAQVAVSATSQLPIGAWSATGLVDGSFVVTWSQAGAINARVFSAAGVPLGSQFLANTATALPQGSPDVFALADGRFVVTWHDVVAYHNDDDVIRAQVFDSTGAKIGTEINVAGGTTMYQDEPVGAQLANGNFVIVWQDSTYEGGAPFGTNQYRGQLFDSTGAETGSEFTLPGPALSLEPLEIASLPGGGFLAYWGDTRVQRYDAAGLPVGSLITIVGSQLSVSVLDSGAFAVGWRGGTYDTSNSYLVQLYDPEGNPLGAPAQVDPWGLDPTAYGFYEFHLSALAGGDIVATWRTELASGAGTVVAQVLDGPVIGTPGNDAFAGGSDDDRYVGLAGNDDIDGGGGDDLVEGGAGRDDIAGGLGHDTIFGGSGDDTIDGDEGFDTVRGEDGNDTLTGFGFEADWMMGGRGDDTLIANGGVWYLWGGDDPDEGWPGGWNLTFHGEDLSGEDDGNDHITLNNGAFSAIDGGSGNDIINVIDGTEVIIAGGTGNDLINATGMSHFNSDAASLAIDGGAGNDVITVSGSGPMAVLGNDGNDEITVTGFTQGILGLGAGDDLLRLPAGTFAVDLGTGRDMIVMTGTGTGLITIDGFGAGALGDRLDLSVYGADPFGAGTLAMSVNGQDAYIDHSATGMRFVLHNVRPADLTADNLGVPSPGGMFGGPGDDVYLVDSGSDVVIELPGEGNDTIYTTIGYALAAGSEIETLTMYDRTTTDTLSLYGNEYGQLIYGNNGRNLLSGGGGADTLFGMGGDDAYAIDGTGDVVYEFAGGGYDVIYTTGSFSLSYSSEVELITVEDRSTTNALTLFGNALGQTLYGNAGANALNGGGGSDVMVGFAGDDNYVVDSLDDVVIEIAGQGSDTVYAIGSYALGVLAEVELLMAYDRSATDTLAFSGSAYGQTIYGSMGTTFLNGNGGADVLYGLGGDDAYLVDWLDDAVIEFAGQGTDTVYASASFALTAGSEVEVLTVYDRTTSEAINLNGNELANTIYGNAGTNVIDGKGGSDTIYLMGGTDTVSFTTPLGSGNVDAVVGFTSGNDKLQLDSVTFAGLGSALPASAFALGSAAGDANDRIVYDQAGGQLWFDADGNGAGAAVLFATLDPGTLLAVGDFIVV